MCFPDHYFFRFLFVFLKLYSLIALFRFLCDGVSTRVAFERKLLPVCLECAVGNRCARSTECLSIFWEPLVLNTVSVACLPVRADIRDCFGDVGGVSQGRGEGGGSRGPVGHLQGLPPSTPFCSFHHLKYEVS